MVGAGLNGYSALLIISVKLSVSAAARNLAISLQDKKISELSPEGLTLSFTRLSKIIPIEPMSWPLTPTGS